MSQLNPTVYELEVRIGAVRPVSPADVANLRRMLDEISATLHQNENGYRMTFRDVGSALNTLNYLRHVGFGVLGHTIRRVDGRKVRENLKRDLEQALRPFQLSQDDVMHAEALASEGADGTVPDEDLDRQAAARRTLVEGDVVETVRGLRDTQPSKFMALFRVCTWPAVVLTDDQFGVLVEGGFMSPEHAVADEVKQAVALAKAEWKPRRATAAAV